MNGRSLPACPGSPELFVAGISLPATEFLSDENSAFFGAFSDTARPSESTRARRIFGVAFGFGGSGTGAGTGVGFASGAGLISGFSGGFPVFFSGNGRVSSVTSSGF